MSKNAEIKLARKVVEKVQAQLMKNLNIIKEEAHGPMQAMISEVTGGVWIGEGADAFTEEVSSLVIPGVGEVGECISTYNNNIQNAVVVIDSADEQVSSLVNSVADLFDGIF
ncbi:MAG: hypothetical protein ACPG8W_00020 [Candidatus Promineifilaceae bacterium]